MYLSDKRLDDIFDNLRGLEIAVIGDVMLDRYLWGDTERISPEAPVPVVRLHHEEIRIGGAANVADNLMVLGAKPALIAIIGEDPAGEQFLEHAGELGLDTGRIIVDSERPTTVKTRIIARHQQVCRVDREVTDAISGHLLESVLAAFDRIAGRVAAVIISDYGKGMIMSRLVSEIVGLCRNSGAFVAVDPKEHHWDYYSGVDLVKPNQLESAHATNIHIDSEQSLERAGWKLLEMTGAKAALISRGERGMTLFEPTKPVKHFATMAREVYDVTGAGDSVIAAATAALAAGATLEEAAIVANHAAGIVVAEVGTAAATPEEIYRSMARERNRNRK